MTMTIYVVVSLKSHLISGEIFIFTSLLTTSPCYIHPMEGGKHGELTAYIIKNHVQDTFPNSNLNHYETTAFMFLCRGYNSTSKQWTSITTSLGLGNLNYISKVKAANHNTATVCINSKQA